MTIGKVWNHLEEKKIRGSRPPVISWLLIWSTVRPHSITKSRAQSRQWTDLEEIINIYNLHGRGESIWHKIRISLRESGWSRCSSLSLNRNSTRFTRSRRETKTLVSTTRRRWWRLTSIPVFLTKARKSWDKSIFWNVCTNQNAQKCGEITGNWTRPTNLWVYAQKRAQVR